MNRIVRAAKSFLSKAQLTGRITGGAITLVSIAALMFSATAAHASCGLAGAGSKSAMGFPMMAQAGSVADDGSGHGSYSSIVGLWHVVYTASDGSLFNQSLDLWHSDHTEQESAWLPPEAGNVCFGVWKEVAPRTVRVHHLGWTFTPGGTPATASGYFVLDELNTVSRDGRSYSGTFIFRTYNINGGPTGVVKGTIASTRITVE